MATITPYARMFGVASPRLGLDGTHSGLTPLGPPRPLLPSQRDMRDEIRNAVENFQKEEFKGFTSQMLVDVDAITNRELNPSDLNAPLHPLLRRDHWAQLPQSELDALPPNYIPGENDKWSASIDSVWRCLFPSLALVSVILKHFHNHPWFEALMIGDREQIDFDRFDITTKLHVPVQRLQKYKAMKLRPPGPKDKCKSQEVLLLTNTLLPFVEFDFMDAKMPPGANSERGYASGLTQLVSERQIRIWIARQDVAPLLRDDLTSSQRLGEQLFVAHILLHELMHAYNGANEMSNSQTFLGWKTPEPYFEDETCGELGFSAENAFYGGVCHPFVDKRDSRPHLGFFHGDWPDPAEGSSEPCLIDPPLSAWRVARPIPVPYYEMIQSSDFWAHHFRSFGIIWTELPACVAVQSRQIFNAQWFVQTRTAHSSWFQQSVFSPLADLIQMTPDERTLYDKKMKTASVEKIFTSLDARNGEVRRMVDQSEICERYKGPPEDPRYIGELRKLLPLLDSMICRMDNCIAALREIESGGEKRIDVRNNILGFQHNLRKFLRSFGNSSDAQVENHFLNLFKDLETNSADFELVPTVIDAYNDPAICEEQWQMQLLQTANQKLNNGDMEGCRSDCIVLMSSLGTGMPQRCRARLVYAKIPIIPVQERRQELNRALLTMRFLYERHEPWSTSTLGDFEKEAGEVLREIDAAGANEQWY